MNRFIVLTSVALLASPPAARADTTDAEPPSETTTGVDSLKEAAMLPLTTGAAHPYAAIVTAFGGYDSARNAGVLDILTEIKLIGPLSIRGGVTYVSDKDAVKPTLGLVVQVLDQRRQGISGSVGVFYKPEGLTELEGEIEGVIALSRVFDRTTAAVNFAYGQDPEGTERDGEVRLAVLYRIGAVFTGVDSRLRFAIGDPKNMEPKLDFVGGPLVSYGFAEYAATLQVGVSMVKVDTVRTGAIALAGFSRVF